MNDPVVRRQVLKQGCAMGLCACAGTALGAQSEGGQEKKEAAPPVPPEEVAKLQWWMSHTQKQTARLWQLLETRLDEKTRVALLEELGRNCAASLDWARQYQGNIDGFIKYLDARIGEKAVYDKEKGTVTITTPERDCVCRMVNSKLTPPIFCACSMGWQKYTYEIILNKKVEVEVKESVLRGSKRCVFEVRILA
jgi:predicted hydrocarbon binding protein